MHRCVIDAVSETRAGEDHLKYNKTKQKLPVLKEKEEKMMSGWTIDDEMDDR